MKEVGKKKVKKNASRRERKIEKVISRDQKNLEILILRK